MSFLKNILIKYNLLEEFDIEVNNKQSFLNQLNLIVKDGFYYPILFIFDTFFNTNKKYIGKLDQKGFKIRDKFDGYNSENIKLVYVEGQFIDLNKNKIKLKIKIQGMSYIRLIFNLIVLLIYSLMMFLLIVEALMIPRSGDIDWSYIYPPIFVTFFVLGFVFVQYNLGKSNVKDAKNDFDETVQLILKTTYNNM